LSSSNEEKNNIKKMIEDKLKKLTPNVEQTKSTEYVPIIVSHTQQQQQELPQQTKGIY
jgi:hypothetical protein